MRTMSKAGGTVVQAWLVAKEEKYRENQQRVLIFSTFALSTYFSCVIPFFKGHADKNGDRPALQGQGRV